MITPTTTTNSLGLTEETNLRPMAETVRSQDCTEQSLNSLVSRHSGHTLDHLCLTAKNSIIRDEDARPSSLTPCCPTLTKCSKSMISSPRWRLAALISAMLFVGSSAMQDGDGIYVSKAEKLMVNGLYKPMAPTAKKPNGLYGHEMKAVWEKTWYIQTHRIRGGSYLSPKDPASFIKIVEGQEGQAFIYFAGSRLGKWKIRHPAHYKDLQNFHCFYETEQLLATQDKGPTGEQWRFWHYNNAPTISLEPWKFDKPLVVPVRKSEALRDVKLRWPQECNRNDKKYLNPKNPHCKTCDELGRNGKKGFRICVCRMKHDIWAEVKKNLRRRLASRGSSHTTLICMSVMFLAFMTYVQLCWTD